MYSLKKPYKVWLRIVFMDMNSPNPLFYRCKFLPYQKQDTFLDFYEKKKRVKMKGLARSAAGWRRNRFTLCVCFCVFPSLNLNENPIRSETSVREQCVLIILERFVGFTFCSQVVCRILCWSVERVARFLCGLETIAHAA